MRFTNLVSADQRELKSKPPRCDQRPEPMLYRTQTWYDYLHDALECGDMYQAACFRPGQYSVPMVFTKRSGTEHRCCDSLDATVPPRSCEFGGDSSDSGELQSWYT